MKIKRVLVSYKQTTYALYVKQNPTAQIKRLLREGHLITHEMKRAHDMHLKSMSHVEKILKKYKIETHTKRRSGLTSMGEYDLVLSIGGDGTFLRTTHYIRDHPPILGINSSPDHSVGALCSLASADFEAKLVDIIEGRVQIEKVTRLTCRLNGLPIPELILNDALVSNACPAAATRAILSFRNKTEEQKNSGIWIATPTGATAAIGAAGGKAMPKKTSRRFQFVIREPYLPFRPDLARYKIIRGLGGEKDAFEAISQMGTGAIYIDGPRVSYPFNFGDHVQFTLSDCPLKVIR